MHSVMWAVLLSAGVAAAQDVKPKTEKPAEKKETKKAPAKPAAITNPAEAGPDFAIQGEYEGEIAGKGKLGVQVFAAGDGKFDVYFLSGGLPGAGWDLKGRVKVPGATVDGKTSFSGGGYEGIIADGKLAGSSGPGSDLNAVKVERKSPTAGKAPPAGAEVLFDGKNADQWSGGKIVEDNLLFCGTNCKKQIAVGTFHIEFRTPFQSKARGQGRGNSGVYIFGREIQVLDSFALEGANNECGAFYSARKPDVNMCFPPLSWQTYDVEFRVADGKLVCDVLHNGVKVHEGFVLGKPDAKGNINLQNHGNPVVYRNIWFAPAKP